MIECNARARVYAQTRRGRPEALRASRPDGWKACARLRGAAPSASRPGAAASSASARPSCPRRSTSARAFGPSPIRPRSRCPSWARRATAGRRRPPRAPSRAPARAGRGQLVPARERGGPDENTTPSGAALADAWETFSSLSQASRASCKARESTFKTALPRLKSGSPARMRSAHSCAAPARARGAAAARARAGGGGGRALRASSSYTMPRCARRFEAAACAGRAANKVP